ncbi:hypothetical protein D3C72_1915440 [compost metagenome]
MIRGARGGEHDAAVLAQEQPQAQVFFKQADLAAYGGWRHAEFRGRAGNAAQAADDLETAQRIQRRQGGHLGGSINKK